MVGCTIKKKFYIKCLDFDTNSQERRIQSIIQAISSNTRKFQYRTNNIQVVNTIKIYCKYLSPLWLHYPKNQPPHFIISHQKFA